MQRTGGIVKKGMVTDAPPLSAPVRRSGRGELRDLPVVGIALVSLIRWMILSHHLLLFFLLVAQLPFVLH